MKLTAAALAATALLAQEPAPSPELSPEPLPTDAPARPTTGYTDENGVWIPPSRDRAPDTDSCPRSLVPPEPVEATAGVPEGAPEQFRWRRAHHRVVRVEGPERIAPEWWREDCGETRDYFRVEDEAGERLWIFRAGDGEDAATGSHRWFLHGVFG